MKSAILLIIITFSILSCSSNSKVIPTDFLGNYFDVSGENYWVGLIDESFIVYENDFWNYKTKPSSENQIKLQLWKESGEKEKLHIVKKDSLFLIHDSKGSFKCKRNGKDVKVLPGNEIPLLDAGIAVIKGIVFDDTAKNTQIKITAKKYYSARGAEIKTAEVDLDGRFAVSIPILNSQSVFLNCGKNRWRRIFITPGDSLTILINGQNGRPVHFMGTNSDVCYHMENVLDTLHQLGEARHRRWGLEPLDFRKYMDSLSSVQLNFLASYSVENQCSDLFVQWCKSFIDCTRANELGRYPFMSTRYGMGAGIRLDIDHPYFEFIESINFNDTMLLLEANTGLLVGNLDNYYHKVLRKEINSEARIHQDIYNFLKDYSSQISDDNIEFIESLSDSLETHHTFSRSLVNRLVSIADPFKDEYEFRLMKAQMDRRIDYFMDQEYSLMRDLMLMKVYADMEQARKLDVLDHVYNRILPVIQFPVFREDLKNEYSAFLLKIESLQNIEFAANKSSSSGEALLLDIINSNKDTVVILDFWYTACGPCRIGFEKMKTIKKQMFDVPVNFVYLCYSSSEKDWTSIVKEFDVKGEHYLLSGEQFAYFSDLFNISFAPRYVLIGKNGKIANDDFVHPQSYQQYIGALKKYLDG